MKLTLCQFDGVYARDALPLAAGLLAAAARADPALADRLDVELVIRRPPVAAAAAACADADVLGLSLYPWNQQYALEVARQVRARRPDVLVVAGGPIAPRCPDRVRRFLTRYPVVDVLVSGEGEAALPAILRAHLAGDPPTGVPGVACRDAAAPDGLRVDTPPPRVEAFSPTASPYLDGTFDRLLAVGGGRPSMALLETNRGCPFSCAFCGWGRADQRTVVELPLERVQGELEWIATRAIPVVYLLDANFGLRRRDPDIVRHLTTLKARHGSPAFCHFHLTKSASERHLAIPEQLKAAGIGCYLSLSTQDYDPVVLAASGRANLDPEAAAALRAASQRRGIDSFNELMLGLPAQTYPSFSRGIARAAAAPAADRFLLHVARVVENAAFAEPEFRARHGIETRRCRSLPPNLPYTPRVDEYEELVVATATLPAPAWRRAYRFGYLVGAFKNGRLLDVVLAWLDRAHGVDLHGYLEDLAAALDEAPAGTVLATFGAVLDRYITSIEAGGPLVLPAAAAGDAPREPNDALVIEALRDLDRFLAEVHTRTAAYLDARGAPAAALAEAFRYQAFVTPRPGRISAEFGRFEHDWAALHDGADTLAATPVALTWVPPAHARAPDFAAFVEGQLTALYTRGGLGSVVRF